MERILREASVGPLDEVLQAGDGGEAVERLSESKVDVMLWTSTCRTSTASNSYATREPAERPAGHHLEASVLEVFDMVVQVPVATGSSAWLRWSATGSAPQMVRRSIQLGSILFRIRSWLPRLSLFFPVSLLRSLLLPVKCCIDPLETTTI